LVGRYLAGHPLRHPAVQPNSLKSKIIT